MDEEEKKTCQISGNYNLFNYYLVKQIKFESNSVLLKENCKKIIVY